MKELNQSLESKLTELEKARVNQRNADKEVQRLKVELANINVRLAMENKVDTSRLSAALAHALDAW